MDAPPSIRLREPAGERRIDAPLRIGGAAGDLVRVPGVESGEALRIEWRGDGWLVTPERAADVAADVAAEAAVAGATAPLINGEPLAAAGHELRAGDVFAIGEARVVATRIEPAALELDVRHLVGNDTVAPLNAVARSRADAEEAADSEVVAAALDLGDGGAGDAGQAVPGRGSAAANRRLLIGALAICGVVLAFLFGIVGRLQRVAIEVDPADTAVSSSGLVSWYSAPTLFLLPGTHTVRGEREGYAPLERRLEVREGQAARLALRLTKLPGIVAIDTGGVAATVTVDGAEAGKAPGELSIPAGERTLTLRAERHLDVVQKLTVEGAGARQELSVRFQPSWGQLAVSATTPGAAVAVEGTTPQPLPLPATLDLPAGVHRLTISAPGARDWSSTVLVKAGETTTLGPLTLGAPDATLAVRSSPAGAEVTVAGAFRGRTPLEVTLPGGTEYDVLVTRAGHATWQRRVRAEPGAKLGLDARLEPIMTTLTVRGEPADGEVFVDGVSRGRAPLSLQLLATRHQLEVRRAGSQPYRAEVDLTPALARTVEYALTPEGRAPGWKPPTETLTGKLGTALRLVPAGTFQMGSERREQGRRPNETLRRVTLSRPFYIGVREVTNAEFRRFRPNHASGFVDKRSVDLDGQSVTNVGWVDAVQYCNWLSEQEGLPPAYEQQGGGWVLKSPATTGYRLPTEAEWEYAARFAGAGRPARRYDWGDALPVPPGHANLAGAEAVGSIERVLDGWSDEYQAIAPPGKFTPNALGLFDMTGNVSEWTHDVYASFIEPSPATDPTGPAANGPRRVIKGSNWRTASFSELRAAWREGGEGPARDVGFRVARHAD